MRNGSPKVASSRALDDELDELELPDSPTGSFIGGGSAPTVNLDVVTSELETIANTVEQFTPREPTAPAAAANSQSGEVEAQQKQRRPTAKSDAELRQPYHPELPKGEVPLVDLFNYRRLHLSNGKPLPCRSKFLWILWLFPVGIVIFILRWLLFTLVSCTLTCALMCCGRTSCSASMAQRVAVRTMCFIFCIRVKIHNRENLPNRDTMPPIIVSNHLSELDFMAVQNLQFSRVLAMDIYRTMPFIGTILKSINTVFVPRLSRGGKREEVRAAVLKHLDSVVRRTGSMEDLGTIARTDKPTSSNKDQPILVFPEGGLTNGHHGLMRYHQFMFSLGLPVLPLAVSLRPVLPYSLDLLTSTFMGNMTWFMWQPGFSYEISVMPIQKAEAGEDGIMFANRVQKMTAQILEKRATAWMSRDKRRLFKAIKKKTINPVKAKLRRNSAVAPQSIDVVPEWLQGGPAADNMGQEAKKEAW